MKELLTLYRDRLTDLTAANKSPLLPVYNKIASIIQNQVNTVPSDHHAISEEMMALSRKLNDIA